MLRRLMIANVALMTVLLAPAFEGRTADAQGLFRRLRSRIQSRIQTPPVQPSQSRPSLTPPQQPASGMQRIGPRPANPASPAPGTSNPTRAPQVQSPQGQPRPQAGQPSQAGGSQASRKPAVKTNDFGGSILNSSSQPPAPGKSAPAAPKSPAPSLDAQSSARQRASLGIQVIPVSSGVPGLQVVGFRNGTLADKAGLKKGDVIVAIDGKATPTAADIGRLLETRSSGDRIRARIVRGRTTSTVMIPLVGPVVAASEPQPAPSAPAELAAAPIEIGIRLGDSQKLRGVVISDVASDSPAAAAGLRVGDRIVSIDGRMTLDSRAFQQELAKRSLGEELSLRLVRNNTLMAADLTLADPGDPAKPGKRSLASGQGESDSQGGSVLENVGSVLGGLLGGNSKSTTPARDSDEMAFGDREPIDQVVFESEIKKLDKDPPSVELLELPQGDAVPIGQAEKAKPDSQSTQTAEELREEIRRLEQRLKEIDSKQ